MVSSNKQEPRMTTTTDGSGDGKTQTNKKQVRRRLHTTRPYQERLLNMAEARREIVTALKQHRASMRQAAKIPPPPQSLFSPPPPPPPPVPFTWTTNPSLNFLLPNQPLGLNLNFHDFNDFIQTSSSSSSSTTSSSIFPTNPHIYSSPSPPPTFAATSDYAPSSAGENQQQQQMLRMMESENNVATSAWWSELMMKTVEPEIIKPEVVEDDIFPKLSDDMEFPSWLNTTEEELFHPYNLTHYSSLLNPPLSCMEIGEIEGMDGDDWFCLNPKD